MAAEAERNKAPAGAGGLSTTILAAPVAIAAGLLLFTAVFDGAFAVRHWAPVAVFALAALAARLAVDGLPGVRGRALLVAVGGTWGLAIWSLASITWAGAPGDAFQDGLRTTLYAGLFTLPLILAVDRRAARIVAWLSVGGLAALAAGTLVALLASGADLYLAGRLDEPVGYRNGTAALFAIAFWPLVAAAAPRERAPLLRAAAFACAALSLGLVFATQARGVAIGLAAGALVALGVGPDRVRRTWIAIIAVGGMVAVSGPLLAPFDAFTAERTVPAEAIDDATRALLILTTGTFALGALAALLDGGLRITAQGARRLRRAAVAVLATFALGAAGLTAVAVGNPVSFASERLDDFRTLETQEPEAGGPRLTGAIGGQRYDLWRIAVNTFADRPVAGAGEGSYRIAYFQERQTDRNVLSPHSLPFRLLAELGAIGALLALAALVGFAVYLLAGSRGLDYSLRRPASALAAAGAVAIGQSVTDWVDVIPAVFGIGVLFLGLSAALVAAGRPPAPRPRPLVTRLLPASAVAVLVLAVAALYVSDTRIRDARAADDPQERLEAARSAERLDRLSLTPLFLKAGALEELGRAEEARHELWRAIDREPGSFVPWGLLGDLEARAGNEHRARRAYRRALELNPLDSGLAELAGGA